MERPIEHELKVGDKITLNRGGLYGFRGDIVEITLLSPLMAKSGNGVEAHIKHTDILPKDWQPSDIFVSDKGFKITSNCPAWMDKIKGL